MVRYGRSLLGMVVAAAAMLAVSVPAQGQTVQQRWFTAFGTGDIATATAMLDAGQVSVATVIDDQQNTALHLAAERCNAPMVRLLMSRGGSVTAPNHWGDTPRRIAMARCGFNAAATDALHRPPTNSGQANRGATGAPGFGASQRTPDPAASSRPAIPRAINDGGAGSLTHCLSAGWEAGAKEKQSRYRTNYVSGGDYLQGWQIYVVTNNCGKQAWVLSASCIGAQLQHQHAGGITDLSGGSGSGPQGMSPGDKLIISFRGSMSPEGHLVTLEPVEIVYAGYADPYIKSPAYERVKAVKTALWHRLNIVDGNPPNYNLGNQAPATNPNRISLLRGVPCGQARLYDTWMATR